MHRRVAIPYGFFVTLAIVATAPAQTSSLSERTRRSAAETPRKTTAPPESPRPGIPRTKPHPTITEYSWIAVAPRAPKTFKVHDIITIVIREQTSFEADADLKSKKDYQIESELDAFIKIIGGGVGEAQFRRGKPTIDYTFKNDVKYRSDTSRKDRLTARVAATIVDVKPNGLLVLEAKARITHDEEITVVRVTGTCRKEDVTPDNTILSTQLADKTIELQHEGAVRDGSRRGWLIRLLDAVSPF